MRILRVVSDLYPSVVGGIGIHAHQMSTRQAQLGHEVTVLTLNQRKMPKQEWNNGYFVVRCPSLFTICGNSFAPSLLAEILKRRKNIDIIHAHSHLFFSTNLCVLSRLLHSAPLIITNHGLISASAPEWLNNLYTNTISTATFHIADHIICYTDTEKKNIERLGIDNKKISVIHNGVDTNYFTPFPVFKPEGRKQIVWVGRYVPGKGVDYLIEAFSIVRKKIPETHLTLVGDGPEKAAIMEMIRKMDLQSSVTLVPYLDNAELPMLYRQSDVFVLPSIMEGVPRTLLEAMACGIPFVITDLPHLRHIAEGAGVLAPPRDPIHLADSILGVLGDSDLSRKMGRKGRERMETGYSWDDTVNKTILVYKKVIKNH
jgi:glycosyltransferase involved in cell wall biosynthesis